ncbi:MAG TPA: beta-ketoacyl synthase chain length factor [Burkholderiales bacterium]|nr:beta-ketoacyl synthase chain length factor [Burkholderiales bacterium]
MRVYVEGVGLVGPGLHGWEGSRAVLAGTEAYVYAPTVIAASELLPAAERRRTGAPVKLALAAGSEAFSNAARDAATTATVFTSSGGDGENVHQMCETLASEEREVSPTRFHNSVHNAAAGYWSIATGSREPSTSLCGYDSSFAAGLLEAAAQVATDRAPVALIAYDHRYPHPLSVVRPINADFAMALVLTAEPSAQTLAILDVSHVVDDTPATPMSDAALETVRAGVPAGRSLPLLVTLARRQTQVVILEYTGASRVRVVVRPC